MCQKKSTSPLFWAVLAIPVLYLAALLASGYEDGMTLFDLLGRFNMLLERPFSVRWTPYTMKFMLVALLMYGFAVVLYCSTRENLRLGEEHGSAQWGNVRQLCAKYRDKDLFQNTLLTQNLRMGLNGKKHRRNLLQIVIGGSGAGKSRTYAVPNIMQCSQAEPGKGGGCFCILERKANGFPRKTLRFYDAGISTVKMTRLS